VSLFRSPPWDSATYWALDLETGGLNPGTDAILAVGMVPIRAGTIRLGESYATLVRPEGGRGIDPRSVQAHQLVWGEVKEAPPLDAVLPEIEKRLREGIMLVHHWPLDVGFLKLAFRSRGRMWPSPPIVDTVDLLVRAKEKSRFIQPNALDDIPVLNLGKARREYGLPDYAAHDALTDAVAAAELFLVLRKRLRVKTVRDLR
jgi:DNA polymerase-3 subunit epsilon